MNVTTKVQYSPVLDIMRALAAFVVVLSHLRRVMFVDYALLEEPISLMAKALYFVTGFGHEALILFFVLSGYLVAGPVIASVRSGIFSFSDYFVPRAMRLYVPLAAALFLTAIIDVSGDVAFGEEPWRAMAVSGGSAARLAMRDGSVGAFVGNLFMLQDIKVPPFGTNIPLWCVSYWFWYYALWPSFLLIFFAKRGYGRCVAAVCTIAMVCMLPATVLLYLLVWLAGLLSYCFKRSSGAVLRSAALAMVLCQLITIRGGFWLELSDGFRFIPDIFLALCYAVLIGTCQGVSISDPMAKGFAVVSRYSYMLYLVHFPVIVLALRGLHMVRPPGFGRHPSLAAVLFACALFVLCNILAAGFAHVLMEPTKRAGDYLRRVLKANPLSRSAACN